jgi:hypothetical protein
MDATARSNPTARALLWVGGVAFALAWILVFQAPGAGAPSRTNVGDRASA